MDMRFVSITKSLALILMAVLVSVTFRPSLGWSKTAVFIDNSASLFLQGLNPEEKKTKRRALAKMIHNTLAMARSKNQQVTFTPIGDSSSGTVDTKSDLSLAQIKSRFGVDESYTRIASAFDHAQRAGAVTGATEDIIIICDMQPDHLNATENWILLSEDFQDLEKSYELLEGWVTQGKNIHFFILEPVGATPIKLSEYTIFDNDLVLEPRSIKNELSILKNRSASYLRTTRKAKHNVELVSRMMLSLKPGKGAPSSSGAVDIKFVSEDKLGSLRSYLRGVLFPSQNTVKVRIELDKSLADFTGKDAKYVNYLKHKGQPVLGFNPSKKVEYTINICVNEQCNPDGYDPQYTYHYFLLEEMDGVSARLYTHNKEEKQLLIASNSEEKRKRHTDREKLFYYANPAELFEKYMRYEIETLLPTYYKEDFPPLLDQMNFKLINPLTRKQNMAGYMLGIKVNGKLLDYKFQTDQDGEATLFVPMESTFEVILSSKNQGLESLFPLATTSLSDIEENNLDRSYSIELDEQVLSKFSLSFTRSGPSQNTAPTTGKQIQIEIFQRDKATKKLLESGGLTRQEDQTYSFTTHLLPGKYYYNLYFSNESFRDLWFEELYIEKDSDKEEKFYLENYLDLLRGEGTTEEQKKQSALNELDRLITSHKGKISEDIEDLILGSRFFLLRLLQYSDALYNKQIEGNPQDLDTLWKNVRGYLFDGTSDTKVHAKNFLTKGYIHAGFIESAAEDQKPATNGGLLVQAMMDIYVNGATTVFTGNQDLKDLYTVTYMRSTVKDATGLSRKFIEEKLMPK